MTLAAGVKNLTFEFRRWFGPSQVALRDVALAVATGEVHVLLGANGAGKSTLLRVLSGLLSPTRGSVQILGGSPFHRSIRARFSFLGDEAATATRLTPGDFLDLQGALYGMSRSSVLRRGNELLEALGVLSLRNHRMGSLSRGQCRRVQLAQTLLPDVDLLILDEPMSGIDPRWRASARELFMARAEAGCAVILSSHLDEDTRIEPSVVTVLGRGEVRASGPAQQLLENRNEWCVRFRPDSPEEWEEDGIRAALGGLSGTLEVRRDRRSWRDVLGREGPVEGTHSS